MEFFRLPRYCLYCCSDFELFFRMLCNSATNGKSSTSEFGQWAISESSFTGFRIHFKAPKPEYCFRAFVSSSVGLRILFFQTETEFYGLNICLDVFLFIEAHFLRGQIERAPVNSEYKPLKSVL